MKTTLKCKGCGYCWETESEKQWVTCPDCLNKVNAQDCKVEEKKK